MSRVTTQGVQLNSFYSPPPATGSLVSFTGRTSGHIRGVVSFPSTVADFTFPINGTYVELTMFGVIQVLTDRPAAGGDSGSALIRETWSAGTLIG